MSRLFDRLRAEFFCEITHTGSRAMCNPAPTDTDDDYLVFVRLPGYFSKLVQFLLDKGWQKCYKKDENGEEALEYDEEQGEFLALRKGELNLIISQNADFVERLKIATDLCRGLNLLRKDDRVLVFSTIRAMKLSEPLPKENAE